MYRDWEREAVREIVDVLKILCSGGFETKGDLLNRLKITSETIDLSDDDDFSIFDLPENLIFMPSKLPGRNHE